MLFEISPHTPKNFYKLGFTSHFVFFSPWREEKSRAKPIMEKESELPFSMIVLALTENLHRDFLSQNDVKFSPPLQQKFWSSFFKSWRVPRAEPLAFPLAFSLAFSLFPDKL